MLPSNVYIYTYTHIRTKYIQIFKKPNIQILKKSNIQIYKNHLKLFIRSKEKRKKKEFVMNPCHYE